MVFPFRWINVMLSGASRGWRWGIMSSRVVSFRERFASEKV